MNRASVKIYNNNIEISKVILRGMLGCLALLALTYVLLIGNMVWNIVARKNLEKELAALRSEVGSLELNYLATAEKINLELSRAMGYREARANFATKKSLGSLESSSNEI